MTDTPQVLLAHHLKTLKLPTFLREYDKLARQCATEGADHVRYLVRLTELELIDRERRVVERRIRQAQVPRRQKPRQLRLQGHRIAQTRCWFWSWRDANTSSVVRISSRSATAEPARPISPSVSVWRPAKRGSPSASSRPLPWVHELMEARDEKRLLRLQKQLAKYHLLIIDELGFVPLSKTGAELLFEVFSQRYERGLDPGDLQLAVR